MPLLTQMLKFLREGNLGFSLGSSLGSAAGLTFSFFSRCQSPSVKRKGESSEVKVTFKELTILF